MNPRNIGLRLENCYHAVSVSFDWLAQFVVIRPEDMLPELPGSSPLPLEPDDCTKSSWQEWISRARKRLMPLPDPGGEFARDDAWLRGEDGCLSTT